MTKSDETKNFMRKIKFIQTSKNKSFQKILLVLLWKETTNQSQIIKVKVIFVNVTELLSNGSVRKFSICFVL